MYCRSLKDNHQQARAGDAPGLLRVLPSGKHFGEMLKQSAAISLHLRPCCSSSCRCPSAVAISNHRLLSFDGKRVSFCWKDYAHGNKQKVMTLDAAEFLRLFAKHILPRGFVRIR